MKGAFNDILAAKFAVEGTVELNQFPLGSLSAQGKFADPDAGKIVYVPGTGKHKPYIRRWVNPRNPKTSEQQDHRILFKQVTQQWTDESEEVKALWNRIAKKEPPYSGQNLYIKRWFAIGKETGTYPGLGFRP